MTLLFVLRSSNQVRGAGTTAGDTIPEREYIENRKNLGTIEQIETRAVQQKKREEEELLLYLAD